MRSKFNEHTISPTKAKRIEELFKLIDLEHDLKLQLLDDIHKVASISHSKPTLKRRG